MIEKSVNPVCLKLRRKRQLTELRPCHSLVHHRWPIEFMNSRITRHASIKLATWIQPILLITFFCSFLLVVSPLSNAVAVSILVLGLRNTIKQPNRKMKNAEKRQQQNCLEKLTLISLIYWIECGNCKLSKNANGQNQFQLTSFAFTGECASVFCVCFASIAGWCANNTNF